VSACAELYLSFTAGGAIFQHKLFFSLLTAATTRRDCAGAGSGCMAFACDAATLVLCLRSCLQLCLAVYVQRLYLYAKNCKTPLLFTDQCSVLLHWRTGCKAVFLLCMLCSLVLPWRAEDASLLERKRKE